MEIKISQTNDLISVRQNNQDLEYGKHTHVQICIHTFTYCKLRFWYFICKVHAFSVGKPVNPFLSGFSEQTIMVIFPNYIVNNWISHMNCAI